MRIALPNPIINIQEVALNLVEAEFNVNKQVFSLKRLEAKGGQVEGSLTGTIMIRKPMGKSRINLRGSFFPRRYCWQALRIFYPETFSSSRWVIKGCPSAYTGPSKNRNFHSGNGSLTIKVFMRIYLILINLFLLTGASYLGVSSFYQVVGARFEVINPSIEDSEKTAAPARESAKPLSEYKAIEERNLFRLVEKQAPGPESVKVDIEALEETKLQLKLWGTVTGNGQNAYAVIEDLKQRVQQLYHMEDAIQNAIVKEIHREKVILEVNGSFEVLQMEEIQGTAGGSKVARRTISEKPEASNTPESKNISLKRERIDEAVNDLGNLMKQVRIRPHFKDGQSDGLTLSGIRSNSIFGEMGFRNGDVIVGVDGKNITSVDDALSLYENLQSAENVQVQIRRRGRLQTIDYAVE